MKLKSKAEKTNFLEKCLEHIYRIHSDLQNELEFNAPILNLSKKTLQNSLSVKINLEKVQCMSTLGIVKLEILICIYNNVANRFMDDSLNLNPLFQQIKAHAKTEWGKEFSPYANMDTDSLMAKRRYKTGFPILDWIVNLFSTPTTSFLKEFGFFESESSFSKSSFTSIPQYVDPRDADPTY